jgi:hypothetical protein
MAPPLAAAPVTFAEVAPILARACVACHRPGGSAPMPLTTYDETRPWARAIEQRTRTREMPPWFIDRRVGIQRFKNDPSLTPDEIATIAAWVEGGAPRGPAVPRVVVTRGWRIGEPDLVVTADRVGRPVPDSSPDMFVDMTAEVPVDEDRFVAAVETDPGESGGHSVHHVLTYLVEKDGTESFLNGYVGGGGADVFPAGAGRLLPAGSRLRFNVHFHGSEAADWPQPRVGFRLYPRGVIPVHEQITERVGEPLADLDIPAGDPDVRHDGYFKFGHAVRLTAFQPHMHNRGKAMCVEAILPDMRVQPLNCIGRFDPGWQLVYQYSDEAAPVLPAETILHVIAWHDNSSGNRNNPDPRNWVGKGGRLNDEMSFLWVSYYTLTDRAPAPEAPARSKTETKRKDP